MYAQNNRTVVFVLLSEGIPYNYFVQATLEKALSERDELKVNQMEKTELLQEKERSSLRIHDLEVRMYVQ